ncbi:MAG: Hsp70 family protein [Myxococcales bacterium]|nr:Hsp70 family protein [Myxococcales bacterium]
MNGARFVVGIDLGTTNSALAYADLAAARDGSPPDIRVLAIDQLLAPGELGRQPLLPSARYHPASGELPEHALRVPWPVPAHEPPHVIGRLAIELGARTPGRLVASAKSWLCHPAVDRTAPILPWGAPSDVPRISPLEASASYLRHLAGAWQLQFPDHPLHAQHVVITIPASFDESARALTLQAAHAAGLQPQLLEEPQAAFYDWLERHRDPLALEAALEDVRLVLVVDVGGGTTDLSLIRVEHRGEGLRLTRIAVGEHLMLGGDNMDLALARHLEPRLIEGAQLGAARFAQLVAQCRLAKEKLLADPAPASVRVTVLGTGSRLVGSARSTELEREEVHRLVVDGFFPLVGPDARPERRRTAIVELGLPYVADAAISRHLAAFLASHERLSREALADRAPAEGKLAVPDAVLFNGGVFHARALVDRVHALLSGWRGAPLRVLDNPQPDLAVARGAVAFALARRGLGTRISAGSARSYFLVLDRRGVCVLPRGAEEGEPIVLQERTFSLRLGRPVRFSLTASSSDVRHVSPGEIVDDVTGPGYEPLPPLAAVLEGDATRGRELPVQLVAMLTEIGTLEVACVDAARPSRRWKLELVLRGGDEDGQVVAATRVGILHPRFAQAVERIQAVYGKPSEQADPRAVKTLRTDLEKILGERPSWDLPLLRELFGALLAGARRRRRSADHERVWFNLAGYCLRPGRGYALDEWRVRQVEPLLDEGIQFAPESQNWAEFWIFWRRIAGGLSAATQARLGAMVEYYLHPPTERPRPRPPGPRLLGYDDMVRLVGALEDLSPDRKIRFGDWLVERLTRHPALRENPQSWAAVGRLGARVPVHGSVHNVVPREVAVRWLDAVMATDWSSNEHAPLAAALLARASGDRDRDLDPELRERVAARLSHARAPASWIRMVREVATLEAADEHRILGDALPPGLRLLDDA